MAKLMKLSEFLTHYGGVKSSVFRHCQQFLSEKSFESLIGHLEKMMDYTILGGKHKRGLLLVNAFRSFKGTDCQRSDLERTCTIGWALEMMQAFFLVADDIMDHSTTRRNKLCWHNMSDVGMRAVNDTLFLENAVDALLADVLDGAVSPDRECLDAFRKAKQATILGQYLDLQTCQDFSADASRDRYAILVRLKTSHYTFVLPLSIASLLANRLSDSLHVNILEFSDVIGHYFQAQDDYLDCFGDPETTGKIGSDIEDGKCTWLLVKALELCAESELTRARLKNNYGKPSNECVADVKRVYNELELPKHFLAFESQSLDKITAIVNRPILSDLQPVLLALVKDLHRRQK